MPRGIRAVAAGVVAGLAVAWTAEGAGRWLQRLGPGTAIVADTQGELSRICVHYDRDFHEQSIETLADLFGALAPTTTVHVVVHRRAEFDVLVDDLQSRGVDGSVDIEPLVTGFPVTPWAKDRFGTFARRGGAVVAVPPYRTDVPGPRGNDGRVPELLCHELPGLRCEPLPFFFEGGDLLADERYVFVTSTLLGRNQPLDPQRRTALLSQISDATGREVVTIGREPADLPDHHVGMYVTPLGDRVVAVADPDLGAAITRGIPRGDALPEISNDRAKIDRFHHVARELESRGFDVVRVPLLLTSTPRVYVSYNNVLLEQGPAGKRIFMPVYGIPELDTHAAQCFEQLGWRVVPVRVGKLYEHTGSLRCLVGILARTHA